MALTAQQKARLAEFSVQQDANKTSTPTPAPTPTATTTQTTKPSITEQIKQRNTAVVPLNITTQTQASLKQPKPAIQAPSRLPYVTTKQWPTKPINIKEQIKAQNASVIEAQKLAEQQEQQKAVDEAVNYANSLYNQNNTDIGLNNIKSQEQMLAQQALTFQQESMKLLDAFSKQFNSSYEDLYKETVDSEKFLQQEKDLASQKASIEELDLQIEGVENDVRNELQGKASESAIQQRVAQRVRDLNKQRARLVDDYTQIYDIYSSEKQEAIQLLGMRVADQQAQEQRQRKVFEQKLWMTQKSFEMQWWLAMKWIDRQEQAYWRQKDMEDKITLSKLSLEQQKEAMTFESELQKKAKWKDIKWIEVNWVTMAVDGQDPSVVYASYGNIPMNGAYQYSDSLNNDALASVIENCVGQNKQCGSFVNDYLQNMGLSRVLGNSYESKKALINSKVPQPGAVFIMWSNTAPENGHTGIVQSVNEDGTINIIDSNWNGDWQVWTRTISHLSVDGYYVPKQSQSYDPNKSTLYINYATMNKVPTEKQIEAMGGIDSFTRQATSYFLEYTNEKLTQKGYKLNTPDFLLSATAEEKQALMKDTDAYSRIVSQLDSLIADVTENWLPAQNYTWAGKLMTAKSRDVQAYLKSPNIYNLGVLNGRDLEFLESVMPTVGSPIQYVAGKDTTIEQLTEVRDQILNWYKDAFASMGISYVWGQNTDTSDPYSVFANMTVSSASNYLDKALTPTPIK